MSNTGRGRSTTRTHRTRRFAVGLAVAAGLLATACGATVSGTGRAGSAPASGALVTVVGRALAQESSATTSYDNVIAKFGQVAPFSQITKSRAENVSALRTIAHTYGISTSEPVPDNDAPPTLALSCSMGVLIVQNNITLYDEVLPQVTAYPDVTEVLSHLRTAAKDSDLPAFQRCG